MARPGLEPGTPQLDAGVVEDGVDLELAAQCFDRRGPDHRGS
jgi:hypothetical protein